MATKREVVEQLVRGEGCLGKAADDEPVFVLRAQDLFSDGLVNQWADLAEGRKCTSAKVAGARADAQAMKNWPIRKYPD